MSELLNLVQAQWPYALALVIGFPLALVALNEAGFALARAGRPVAASVRFIRTWVVPLVALVLFLKWVVLLPSTGLWMRLTESLCWAVAIVAVIGGINNVVFEAAAPGAVGLETLLPAAMRLYHQGGIGLPQLWRALSLNPAGRLGLPGGRLSAGAPADLVLFDPDAPFVLDRFALRSKSRNTPFDGARMEGRVIGTWVGGRRVFGGGDG